MKKVLVIFATMALVCSCCNRNAKNNTENTQAASTEVVATEGQDKAHDAQNSLDYLGTYTGVVNAGGMTGIELTVSLTNDSTVVRVINPNGKAEYTKEEARGKYTWENGSIINLSLREPSRFFVMEGKLCILNADETALPADKTNRILFKK